MPHLGEIFEFCSFTRWGASQFAQPVSVPRRPSVPVGLHAPRFAGSRNCQRQQTPRSAGLIWIVIRFCKPFSHEPGSAPRGEAVDERDKVGTVDHAIGDQSVGTIARNISERINHAIADAKAVHERDEV